MRRVCPGQLQRLLPFFARCLVLLDDLGRDAAAVVNGQTVLASPSANAGGSLTARDAATCRASFDTPARPAGTLDERIDLLAELASISLAQVDHELRTGECEEHSLGCGTAIKIVL